MVELQRVLYHHKGSNRGGGGPGVGSRIDFRKSKVGVKQSCSIILLSEKYYVRPLIITFSYSKKLKQINLEEFLKKY